jgi:hypothetical protein
MKIWSWLTGFRKAGDDAAMKRAVAEAVETPDERRYTSGDIESIQADERAAELTGDTPSDSERLAE